MTRACLIVAAVLIACAGAYLALLRLLIQADAAKEWNQ